MTKPIALLVRSHAHLRDAGEGYFEHLRFAATVGLLAIAAGLACLIHAFIPALCTRTASRTIRLLNRLMDERHELRDVQSQSIDALAFAVMMILALAISIPLWVLQVPTPLAAIYTALAFSIPATLLLTNRELATGEHD